MPEGIQDQLTTYLIDAHSIEEQSLQQLRAAPDIAEDAALAHALREHLLETEVHERRIRSLLEGRGASVSKLKDVVMRAGGSGFVLFARSQVDTAGKLAAHALSYEALEWAAYDLLARTAERAGETEIAGIAAEIRDEERQMMQRIEGLFDGTVASSLREGPDTDIEEKLTTYLADAHAIEAQSLQLLESGAKMMDTPGWGRLFERHREESKAQQELIEQRLEAHGAKPSWWKDAAMRMGALNWGMFFQAQPDTPAKLAAFAFAFEHLEIGGYEQLRRVAERAGDTETVRAVQGILREERDAAARFAGAFDEALTAGLAPMA